MNAQEQNAFIEALFDADKPLPHGLSRPQGGDVTECMDIYRNNVAFSLIHVLGEAFPCLLYTSPSPRDLSTSRMPSSA